MTVKLIYSALHIDKSNCQKYGVSLTIRTDRVLIDRSMLDARPVMLTVVWYLQNLGTVSKHNTSPNVLDGKIESLATD
jgi:hypothetical protein